MIRSETSLVTDTSQNSGGMGGYPPSFLLKREWVLKNTDWGLGTKKYKHEAGKSIKKSFSFFLLFLSLPSHGFV